MPHLKIDYTVLEPGEQYVIDHTRCDFWAREGDVQFRPWLTSMIDARSRRIVGWHLARTPHQDGIVASLRMAFRDCAVPARLHMDNGRDFLSELLTGRTKREALRLRKELGPQWKRIVQNQQTTHWCGILAELGIELVTAIPHSPWSKGLIERWFGTFADQCCKGFAAYCGHDTQSKPEYVEEIRAERDDVPTLDQAREQVGRWIDLYDRTPHSGIDGAKPLEVWNTAERLRRASDEALVMLLQSRGVYRVGKNGVSFRVSGRTFTYGSSSAALRRYAGRDVFIILDPEDASYCMAYTAERGARTYIDRLTCNQRVPANTPGDQLREAVRKVRGRRKVMVAAEREGAARGRNAAQEVAAIQRDESKVAYRATGTDDHRPNIVPVRTGFEGVSRPVQTSFEVHPVETSDLDELLSKENTGDDGAWDATGEDFADLLPNAKDGPDGADALGAFV